MGVEIEEYQYKLDKIDEDYKSSSILLKDKNIRLEAVVKETAELVEINKKRTLELDEHKRDIKELESGLNVREGIVVKKEQRLNKLEESIKIKENLLKEVLEKI